MKKKIAFHLCSADNSDINKVLISKEYATVAGNPQKLVDYVIITTKSGQALLCTLDRVIDYKPFVSKHWTTGKNPKGTTWKSLYMFDNVVPLSVSVLDKFSNILETKTKSNGVTQTTKYQPTGAYVEIYL